MNRIISEFLRDESGQTTTEYVLILAVIVTIFMQFRKGMLKMVKKLFDELNKGTDNAICETEDCSG